MAPIKKADTDLISDYKTFLDRQDIGLIPITRNILEEAAGLRAAHAALRTPDAIHIATALVTNASLFITNDISLRQIAAAPIVVLQDFM